MDWRKYLFELTPLAKADKEVRGFLEQGLEPHQFERYEKSLNRYRYVKVTQIVLKVLLYASIITSVAATVGFRGELIILERLASYIGTTVILLLYIVTSYVALIRREAYHVQREILLAQADWSDY